MFFSLCSKTTLKSMSTLSHFGICMQYEGDDSVTDLELLKSYDYSSKLQEDVHSSLLSSDQLQISSKYHQDAYSKTIIKQNFGSQPYCTKEKKPNPIKTAISTLNMIFSIRYTKYH